MKFNLSYQDIEQPVPIFVKGGRIIPLVPYKKGKNL